MHSSGRAVEMVVSRKGWVKAHWVPREDNEKADMLSKSSLEAWDFGIRLDLARELFKHFFRLELDIFASCTFHVCENYYSCSYEDAAVRLDAFSVITWPDYSYTFPPPLLISKTLTKIEDTGTTVLIVTPRWTATPWWDRLIHMALGEPITLGLSMNTCAAKTGASLSRLGTMVATVVRGKRRSGDKHTEHQVQSHHNRHHHHLHHHASKER